MLENEKPFFCFFPSLILLSVLYYVVKYLRYTKKAAAFR